MAGCSGGLSRRTRRVGPVAMVLSGALLDTPERTAHPRPIRPASLLLSAILRIASHRWRKCRNASTRHHANPRRELDHAKDSTIRFGGGDRAAWRRRSFGPRHPATVAGSARHSRSAEGCGDATRGSGATGADPFWHHDRRARRERLCRRDGRLRRPLRDGLRAEVRYTAAEWPGPHGGSDRDRAADRPWLRQPDWMLQLRGGADLPVWKLPAVLQPRQQVRDSGRVYGRRHWRLPRTVRVRKLPESLIETRLPITQARSLRTAEPVSFLLISWA